MIDLEELERLVNNARVEDAASLIVYPKPKCVSLTAAGALRAPSPNTSVTLIESITSALTDPQKVLFDRLREDGEQHRDALADRINWERGGSHLRHRLAELSAMEVVEYPAPKMVKLQAWVIA